MLLAVAFLLAMQLGTTISLAVSGAHASEGMAMAMPMSKGAGPSSADCPSCNQASDAMLVCMPACGLSLLPAPAAISLKVEPAARIFDQPANESAEGAQYPPDPHPPKANF
jgi:hypothetical protein